jgi:hypothetical protein
MLELSCVGCKKNPKQTNQQKIKNKNKIKNKQAKRKKKSRYVVRKIKILHVASVNYLILKVSLDIFIMITIIYVIYTYHSKLG